MNFYHCGTGRFLLFRSSTELSNGLGFLFEVHRQVVLYKDAELKVTKKIFVFSSLKKHISRIYAQMTLSRQAHLVPASADDNS